MSKAKAKAKGKRPKRTVGGHHREWLSLIEASGPFISHSVLKKTFPQGLDEHDSEKSSALRVAWDEWMQATAHSTPDLEVHEQWVQFVLQEVLEFPEEVILSPSQWSDRLAVRLDQLQETLMPSHVIGETGNDPGPTPRVLIRIEKPGVNLDKAVPGTKWANASPITRMTELVRARRKDGVRLGLVTNGERWTLIHVPEEGNTGVASWWTWLWVEEPVTLRAFRSLLGVRRLFGVNQDETLEALWAQSADQQAEVTTELGIQVRRAVELLVRSIDRIDRDRSGELLGGVEDRDVYRAAVTVMMRLVFLLYAEEHELLPVNDAVWDENYAITPIQASLREAADLQGEEVLERRHAAWNRLVATFRAVHGGVEHDRLTLPAYGGGLFDPDRYPLLEGRPAGSRWKEVPATPLPIDDRTVLEVLESLQFLGRRLSQGREERQRVSFRALGVEQIGHVYESLLDHTVFRAKGPVLSLQGSKGTEPEVEVAWLEEQRAGGCPGLVDALKKVTGRSAKALERALADPEPTEGAVWSAACAGDADLLRQIAPWTSLVRRDLDGAPVVIPFESLYVTQGTDRRSTGTHYTPRSLTEPVVRYTLEPLVYEGPADGKPEEEWRLRSPEQILGLRVCDLAMGSGAFLVQACRYLGDRLFEAWAAVEERNPGKVVVTPEGDVSVGVPDEALVPRDGEERTLVARRFVADRCIFGVDKDPMAVDMAKLSMWLVTLQENRPFTFVDHALREGDSLLGVADIEQLASFDLTVSAEIPIAADLIRQALSDAIEKRRVLQTIPDHEIRQVEEKKRLFNESEALLEDLRAAADLVVGYVMAEEGTDEAQGALASLVSDLLTEAHGSDLRRDGLKELRERAHGLLNRGSLPGEPSRRPMHWLLAFPEVFFAGEGRKEPLGFDAFVGNPPFQGGQKITGVLGADYRDFLVDQIADGSRGSADLCAYMVLRAVDLIRAGASVGLITTNTISQGDTREVGLERLLEMDVTIPRAVSSQKWPGQANLEVAIVWMFSGAWGGMRVLDGEEVSDISAQLVVPGRVSGSPERLPANSGLSFQGSIVLGRGFVLSPEEASRLIKRDPRNNDVLFPYMNGQDLNSRWDLTPSRWVINFHDWSLDTAQDYPACLQIVRENVKPERDRLKREARRKRWWQFAERARGLYSTVANMKFALAVARVSKYIAVARIETGVVFSEATVVFALEEPRYLALLQSVFHRSWVREYQSSLRKDGRYTPSDCFETFAFPSQLEQLDGIGQEYDERRSAIMARKKIGLTALYNEVHDSACVEAEISELRDLQVQVDQQVQEAYGWSHIELDHDFRETSRGPRYTVSEPVRREILDCLLELNHERAAAEGVSQERESAGPPKKPARARKGNPELPQLDGEGAWGRDATELILEFLETSGRALSKAEIIAGTSIPTAQWTGTIRKLLDSGKVTRTGERRGTRYSLANALEVD